MTIKRRTGRAILQGVLLFLFLISAMILVGCGESPKEPPVEEEGLNPADKEPPVEKEALNPAERIWAGIIPQEGTATAYGIPLSFDNAQRFIDWYNAIGLSAEEEATRDTALDALVAPCCDDYPMSSCCCVCNLARSVWGLSAYLITEKSYAVNQVQEAASQWLHFIRPDYYVASALNEEGINPRRFGLTTESSCYADRCELPFYSKTAFRHVGGCGGMEELVRVETD